MTRTSTPAGRLAARGFGDPTSATRAIAEWLTALGGDEPACERVVAQVIASADPDLALSALSRLAAERPDALARLAADPALAHRTARVLGASVALGQGLAVRPGDLDILAGDLAPRPADALRATLLVAVGADPASPTPVAAPDGADPLRLAYRREVLRIAARDLTASDPLAELSGVAAELADLADATIEAALAIARAEVPGWEGCRLGVLALGKAGARELNYVSDVDVLYVAEPAEAIGVATRLVAALSRACSAHTAAGTIWQVDPNLRPEGKAGPLVRTLASHRAYYAGWAKNWEFQAMLKARPMAGDLALAQEFVDLVWPRVWQVGDHDAFIAETQAMRKRVISLIPKREADLEIKLGAGGLRDTEFSVQLLQLVHGRADERLRLRGTFEGLDALVQCGYVGRADGAQLDEAYRFQRVLEHRIQLFRLRRTHLMPTDEPALRRLARSVGLKDPGRLTDQWRASTRQVLRLHRRLFYSPLLEAVARIPSEAVRLTSEAAEVRLRALGYKDPKAALRHLESLSQGVTRQAEIQRQLLPAMLGWFAEGSNPDHGLLAFRQVSEALGRSSWYLRALRDTDAMAENLARVLSSSRYAVDLLMREPQAVSLLSDPEEIRPRTRDQVSRAMASTAGRQDSPERAVQAIRAVRRRELVRLAMADLLGELDLPALGAGLTEVTSATIDATLDVVCRDVPGCPPLALVALGRWGGGELSYSSDADAMVVVADTDDPDATRAAMTVVSRLRALLAAPGPDPALEIDLDLRPEGKSGPMVRSLASYAAYYAKWSSPWEAQALLRAAHGAGAPELSAKVLDAVEGLRYPPGGLEARQVHEIRKLKARMEGERIRGDARRHLKLGPGGLSDVEWTVQLLQLEHAGTVESLRTPSTLVALEAAEAAGLLSAADAHALTDAWVMASRLRNAIMLLRGRATDSIPSDVRELAPVADLMGYGQGESSLMMEDFRRRTRQARQVMDRVFWGLD